VFIPSGLRRSIRTISPRAACNVLGKNGVGKNGSAKVWFVITGASKREALAQWQAGARLPATAVKGRQETAVWLDTAAWQAR